MPVVQWSIDASGAEAGASQFVRATERIEQSARAVARQVDASVAAVQKIGASAQSGGALAGLGTQFDQISKRVDALTKAERELAREQDRRIRVGLTALSTLGEESRAFAQLTQFQIRQAQALGQNIDRTRILTDVQQRLTVANERAAQVFSTQAVVARDLRLNMASLANSMQGLLGVATALGAPGAGLAGQLASAATAAKRLQGGFTTLGASAGVLGAAAVAAGLLAREASQAAAKLDDLDESARTLGTSVQALQRLRFFGAREGVGNIDAALGRLASSLGDPTQEVEEAFERLNLSITRLRGLDVERQLAAIGNAMVQITDPTERAAIVTDLFGRGQLRMLNILTQGAEGMRLNAEEAKRLGIVFDQDLVQSAIEVHGRMEALSLAWQANADKLKLAFLPALESLMSAFGAASKAAADFFGEMSAGDKAASLRQRIEDLREMRALVGERSVVGGFLDDRISAFEAEAAKASAQDLEERRRFTAALGDAHIEAAKGADQHAEAVEALKPAYDDLERTMAALRKQAAEPLDTSELDRVVGILRKQEGEQQRAADQAAERSERQAEMQAKAMQEPFLEASRAIQSQISGALFTAFKGGITDAEDFAQAVLDIVARMAAQIATTKIFGPLLEQIGQGNTSSAPFGLGQVTGGGSIPADASRDEVIEILRRQEANGAQTAQNTGGLLSQLSGMAQGAGAGLAGAFTGMGLAQTLGLRTGAGSLIGGGLGAIGGLFGGPVAGAALGGLGGLFGGEAVAGFSDLFQGRNPFAGQSGLSGAARGAAFGSVFPGFGTALGALIGGLIGAFDKQQKTQAAFLTTAGQGDFRSGISAASPFGTVGLSAARSQSLSADVTRTLVEGLAKFDTQIATLLDQSQIAQVATKLQQAAGGQQSARDFGEKELGRLFVDRGRAIAEALLQGFADADVAGVLRSQGIVKGATQEQVGAGIQGVTDLIRDVAIGRRELRGEEVAEFTVKLESLQQQFRELAPSAQLLDGTLDKLRADLAAGEAALRSDFIDDLGRLTLALTDPLAAAIRTIADEEERLLREAQALGVGFAEVVQFIAASREDLARQTLRPITEILSEIQLNRLDPLARRDVLGQRFTDALAGTDAQAVAQAASDLRAANEAFFGRTSGLFESERFIERGLEAFSERIRDQINTDAAAVANQTAVLGSALEEQTQIQVQLLAANQAMRAEIERLRADLSLVIGRLAKAA